MVAAALLVVIACGCGEAGGGSIFANMQGRLHDAQIDEMADDGRISKDWACKAKAEDRDLRCRRRCSNDYDEGSLLEDVCLRACSTDNNRDIESCRLAGVER
jgi:hypothetical protein